jgi:hypothetical protein
MGNLLFCKRGLHNNFSSLFLVSSGKAYQNKPSVIGLSVNGRLDRSIRSFPTRGLFTQAQVSIPPKIAVKPIKSQPGNSPNFNDYFIELKVELKAQKHICTLLLGTGSNAIYKKDYQLKHLIFKH